MWRPFLVLLGLPAFRFALAIRGLAVWAILRLVHLRSVRTSFFDGTADVTDLSLVEELALLAITGLAVYLDARRRREDLFLGNLGIPAAAFVAVALVLPLILEILLP